MLADLIMNHPQDHIMANIWRLIFERNFRTDTPTIAGPAPVDFALLEQILPEYRLIGLSLADKHPERRYN